MNKSNMVMYKENRSERKVEKIVKRKKVERVENSQVSRRYRYFQQHSLNIQLDNFGIEIGIEIKLEEKKGRILVHTRNTLWNCSCCNQNNKQYIFHLNKSTHQHNLSKKKYFGISHILMNMDCIVLGLLDRILNYKKNMNL